MPAALAMSSPHCVEGSRMFDRVLDVCFGTSLTRLILAALIVVSLQVVCHAKFT